MAPNSGKWFLDHLMLKIRYQHLIHRRSRSLVLIRQESLRFVGAVLNSDVIRVDRIDLELHLITLHCVFTPFNTRKLAHIYRGQSPLNLHCCVVSVLRVGLTSWWGRLRSSVEHSNISIPYPVESFPFPMRNVSGPNALICYVQTGTLFICLTP